MVVIFIRCVIIAFMRIVVPIKQVPETKNVRMDEKTGTVIREGVESIVNPLDLYSIELAIELREKYGGEVIAISMGPAKAVEALREAVAMGVDSAVLVSDGVFGASDTWATSFVLAAGIGKIGDWDLVICGERATDGDTGQVGPGIAAFLDVGVVTYVSRFDSVEGRRCRVERMVEDGYEVLSGALPLVLTVVKEVSDPRLPTLRGKQRARRMEIPVWDNAVLGVDAAKVGLKGSPTRVVKIAKPKVSRQCELCFGGDEVLAADAVEKFYSFLERGDFV